MTQIKQCKACMRKTNIISSYITAQPLAVQSAKFFRKAAFSLAETLVTLAIIGVLAAIIMPGLMTKVNNTVKNTRIKTIETKLRQGTNTLMFLGKINGYKTTEDFVKALSEHMKIISYCSADRITECFPYNKINIEGEAGSVNVADLKTPEAFGLKSDEYSNPVSFITGDGTPYIILYRKNCNIDINAKDVNSTGCISGIYDWNGSRMPNKFLSGTSVNRLDSKTGFGVTDIQYINTIPYLTNKKTIPDNAIALQPAIGDYKYALLYDGGSLRYCGEDGNQPCNGTNGINTCTGSEYASYDDRGDHYYCARNTWAAAVKKCKDLGLELPDIDSLQKLYEQKTSNSDLNEKLTAANSLNSSFWSSTTFESNTCDYMDFGTGNVGYNHFVIATIPIICFGK